MNSPTRHNTHAPVATRRERRRSRFVLVGGVLGLTGSVTVVLADVAGWALADEHNPVRETISRLSVGDRSWIQDVGLNAFAAGLVGIALGVLAGGEKTLRERAGAAGLGVLALDIVALSELSRFDDTSHQFGVIHDAAVLVLYLLFAATAWLLARPLARRARGMTRRSTGLGVLWLVGGPLYRFVTRPSTDGLWERFLAMVLVSWVVLASASLLGWRRRASGRRVRTERPTASSEPLVIRAMTRRHGARRGQMVLAASGPRPVSRRPSDRASSTIM